MNYAELDRRLVKFRDHYLKRRAILPGSMLDMEFLKIIEDYEREDEIL